MQLHFALVEYLWNYSNVPEIVVGPYDFSSYESVIHGYFNRMQWVWRLFVPVIDS